MPSEEEHERLSDELAKDADQLARENERLKHKIRQVRSDWQAKQGDPSVPGATVPEGEDQPQPEDEDEDESEDEPEPGGRGGVSEDRPGPRSST